MIYLRFDQLIYGRVPPFLYGINEALERKPNRLRFTDITLRSPCLRHYVRISAKFVKRTETQEVNIVDIILTSYAPFKYFIRN